MKSSFELYYGKREMLKEIISNPFKAYCKAASWAFGFCFISKAGFGLAGMNPHIDVYKHPRLFMGGVLVRSIDYALIWPSIPILVTMKPKEFFFFKGEDLNRNYFLEVRYDRSPLKK